MKWKKRWIDDVAHELRTPLSIVKVHTDNAMLSDNNIEQNQPLEHLIFGVDRSARIVSQLLVLARLKHQKKSSKKTLMS